MKNDKNTIKQAKRYRLVFDDLARSKGMVEFDDGEWVAYADYEKALSWCLRYAKRLAKNGR